MSKKAHARLGILYMLTSVIALGFMPSLVRKIYEASELTALQVSVWRFVLAAPMLWLFTKLNHRDVHPFSRRSRALLGRAGTVGIFYGLAVVAFFSSLERIPVPVFILIFYSYPIIVAVLSRILGERLTGMFWPAALLTLGGVALTVVMEGEEALVGALLALVSAYLIAQYFVVNQRILRRWHGDSDTSNVAIGVAWIVTSGAVTIVLIAILSGEGLGLAAAREVWWMLLLLSLVVSFGAYVMNLGIQRLGAAGASVVATAEPIFTLFFAWVLLGEWLKPLQLLGGVLILGSAVLRAWRQWRGVGRAETQPGWQEPPDHALAPANRARVGYFWIALTVLGQSLFPIFTRGIYAEGTLRPSDVAAWRFLLATPALWLLVVAVFSRARRSPAGQRPARASAPPGRWPLFAMGALSGCASVCASLALKHLTAGLHIILFYSYPMLVALLSFALGERLPRVFWLVLLGTMSGVVMVIAPELLGAEMGEGIALGGALALLSAFLFACYFQLSRRILRDTPDVLRAVAWSFVGALLALAALAIVTGLRMPGGRGFALLLGLALCSTVLSLVACNFGIQHLGAPRAALMTMATPFVTVVLAVILLNEFLSAPQLIGGTLILASMIVLARASDPQERHLRPQEAEVSTARP